LLIQHFFFNYIFYQHFFCILKEGHRNMLVHYSAHLKFKYTYKLFAPQTLILIEIRNTPNNISVSEYEKLKMYDVLSKLKMM